jgi:hypothetical protein
MREMDKDIQGAITWVVERHQKLLNRFLFLAASLPTFGRDHDHDVRRFVNGLGNWVRANEAWSFSSARYFGDKGLAIQKSRIISLLPRMTVG